MKSPIVTLTSIVAVAFMAATAYLYQDRLKLATALDEAEARNDKIATKRSDVEAKLYHQEKRSKNLKRKLDGVSGQLASAKDWLENMQAAADSSDLAIEVLEEILAEKEVPKEEDGINFFSKLMGSFMSGDIADSIVDMTYDITYGDLNAMLGLTEERADAVRRILKEHQKNAFKMTGDVLTGNAEPEDRGKYDADADLLSALSEVLDPDELEAFEEFEAEIPARMLRNSYQTTLSILARGLSPENRELTLDVLVEETLLANQGGLDPDPVAALQPEILRKQFDSQLAAFEATLDRLSGAMDDDQFAIVEHFVDQQIAMQEMSRRVMQSMLGNNDQR